MALKGVGKKSTLFTRTITSWVSAAWWYLATVCVRYNSCLCAFLKSIKRRPPCRKESPFALNCCRAGSTFLPRKPLGISVEHKIDQDATGPLLRKDRGLFLMTTRALQQSVVVAQVQRKCILCVGVPPSLRLLRVLQQLESKTTVKVSCNKTHLILHLHWFDWADISLS